MILKLYVTAAEDLAAEVSEFASEDPEVTLGRSAKNSFGIHNKEVSNFHAKIERTERGYSFTDLKSLNGSSVNGVRATAEEPIEIRSGDEIVLADGGVTLKVEILDPDAGSREQSVRRVRDQVKQLLEQVDEADRRQLIDELRGVDAPTIDVGGAGDAPVELRDAALAVVNTLAREVNADALLATPDDIANFGGNIRHFLQQGFEAMRQSLNVRQTIHEQVVAEVTMINVAKENPLKSMRSADEISRFVLDWTKSRNPEAARHLEHFFGEMNAHQLGVLAGVEAAAKAVLERLHPDILERMASGRGPKLVRLLRGKGICWDVYREQHANLADERQRLWDEVVVPAVQHAIREAYERHYR